MHKFLFLISSFLLLNVASVHAQVNSSSEPVTEEKIDFGLDVDDVADEAVTATTDAAVDTVEKAVEIAPSAISEEFAEDEIFESADNDAEKKQEPQKDGASEDVFEISKSPAEETVNEAETAKEEPLAVTPENLSKLVEQLNLSDEQLDTLKFLSDESKMRQEQLLKSVEQLKAQAKEIEEQSLREFIEILTPEQKETFEKIRALNTELSAQ